MFIEAENRRLI